MYNSLYDRLYHGGKPQDTLQKSLEGLRSKDDEERTASAKKIRRYLEQEARGRSHESFSKVLNSIIDRIEKWANNSNANDRLACTVLIAEIITIPNDEIMKRTVQFVNQLQIIITQQAIGKLPVNESSSSIKTLETAAYVFGKLSSGPTATTSVFVEFEIKKAIGWLKEKAPPEMKRYAALLVLRELAFNAPTLFNIHSDEFFNTIFFTLCDSKPRIRSAAAVALRHALRVIAQREARQKHRMYNQIFTCARKEFPAEGAQVAKPKSSPLAGGRRRFSKTKSALGSPVSRSASPKRGFGSRLPFLGSSSGANEAHHQQLGSYFSSESDGPFVYKSNNFIHGALLGLYELIGECTGEFIKYRFEEIFNQCVWRKEIRMHNDPLIREAVMMILPRLALHCPSASAFSAFYQQAVDHLMLSASSAHLLTDDQPQQQQTQQQSPRSIATSPKASSSTSLASFSSSTSTGSTRHIKVKARSAAFLALGQMSALDNNKSSGVFQGYAPDIFQLIKDGLSSSAKWPFCKEALDCLRMLMQTQDELFTAGSENDLSELIPLMFNGGLSESLVSTLLVLSACIPDKMGQIQSRLLQELTHILSVSAIRGGKRNRDFQIAEQEKQVRQTVRQFMQLEKSQSMTGNTVDRPWTRRSSRQLQPTISTGPEERDSRGLRADSFNPKASSEGTSSMRELWRDLKGKATNWLSKASTPPPPSLAQKTVREQYDEKDPDTSLQVLALRTFSTFSFKGINLLPLVCAVILRHLDSPEARVRVEAVRACCSIVAKHLTFSRNVAAEEATEAVQHILSRVVMVTLVDDDVMIRRIAIEELSGRFGALLLKNPESVRALLTLTNDQNFYIRAMAVEAIGKLAIIDPPYVMPSISNTLLRLLNELNFAVDSKQREESVVLLGVLVRSVGPSLSRPHITPIINTLLPKINFVRKGVATAMLATLGEVARVGDEQTLSPLLGKVLPIIVEILDDKSSSTVVKRKVALDTLATLASNSAMPIWPYLCYHRLLDHVLWTMVQPGSESLRKQAMFTFGVLGALDPYLYRNQQLLANMQGVDTAEGQVDGDTLIDFGTDRDLRNAVLKAYTNGVDSDDDMESLESSDDASSGNEEEFEHHGAVHPADQTMSAGTDAFATSSAFAQGAAVNTSSSFGVPEIDDSQLAGDFQLSQGAHSRRKGKQGALWASDPRRTSYMVKSDIYQRPPTVGTPPSSSSEQPKSSPTEFKDPFQQQVQKDQDKEKEKEKEQEMPQESSNEQGPARLSINVVPPPPPDQPPPPLSVGVSAEEPKKLMRTMSGRVAMPSATNSLGIPSINVGTHKRSATAAPAFRKTLSKAELLRKNSNKSLVNARSRRKSSIREVAQQIHALSQAPMQTRRRSTMFTVQPSPKASAGRFFTSNVGNNSLNTTNPERDRAGTVTETSGYRERSGTASAMGPLPTPRKTEKAHGSRLRVVLPTTDGGQAQAFEGAAAIAAAAANAQVQVLLGLEQSDVESFLSTTASSILPSSVKKSSEYYPRVAVTALTRVLTDSSWGLLGVHQRTAVDAVNKIFRTLGRDRPLFLPIVVPRMVHVIQSAAKTGQLSKDLKPAQIVEFGKLIEIAKLDIYPYVPAIFELVHEIWDTAPRVASLGLVLTLVDTLTSSMLRPHIAKLLEDLLGVLHMERDELRSEDSKYVLAVIARLGPSLDEHLYLVIPTLTTLVDSTLISSTIRGLAIQTLTRIVQACDISEYATLIIHPLLHALDDCRNSRISQSSSEEDKQKKKASQEADPLGLAELSMHSRSVSDFQSLKNQIDKLGTIRFVQDEHEMLLVLIEVLTALVYRLEEDYAVFAPALDRVLHEAVAQWITPMAAVVEDSPQLMEERQQVETYFGLVRRVLKGQRLEKPPWYHLPNEDSDTFLNDLRGTREDESTAFIPQTNSMDVNMLKATWHTAQISTELEWMEWMRRFSLQLLRQSPKSALQSCYPLAQVCEPLARELFNAAFLSCWDSLDLGARNNVVLQLELALKAPKIPKDLLQVLLNLAEFMEHDNKPLPIDIRILSDVALKCQANAKALRFKELEFRFVPENCIEKLITINNNLEQHEAAAGIVLYARSRFVEGKDVQPEWYERLQAWDEALHAYELRSQELDKRSGSSSNENSRNEGNEGSNGELTARPPGILSQDQQRVNVGRLRCLNRVGGWHTVLSILDEKWAELVSHDLELGRKFTKQRRETQTDESALLPRFKESVDSASAHLGPNDIAEFGGPEQIRQRSFDEISDSQVSSAQPIGVLIRNRSHASSVMSYPTDEEESGSRILGSGGSAVGYRKTDHHHLLSSNNNNNSTRNSSNDFARSGSHDSNGARELVNLFGGERSDARIHSTTSVFASRSHAASVAPTNVIDAAASELKDFYSGLGGVTGTIVMKPEAEAKSEEDRRKRRQSVDVSRVENKDPALEEAEANEKEQRGLRRYAQSLATLGAFAAFSLGKWDEMTKYCGFVNENRTDGNFLKVVKALHENQLDTAQRHIDRCYGILDKELSSLVVESYSRAYPRLIEVQHMVELQEILEYKKLRSENSEEAKLYLNRLRRVWSSRLQGVQNTASVLMPILAYRSLIIAPMEDLDTWLNFAKVARKENLLNLSLQALMRLGIGSESHSSSFFVFNEGAKSITSLHISDHQMNGHYSHLHQEDMNFHTLYMSNRSYRGMSRNKFKVKPRVAFAYIKYIWAVGDHFEAIHRLKRLRYVLKRTLESAKTSFAKKGKLPAWFGDSFGSGDTGKHSSFSLKEELHLGATFEEVEEEGDEMDHHGNGGEEVSSLDLSELDKLRRDVEAREKGARPLGIEEEEEHLEEFYLADLHALDINDRHVHKLRRLLVECDCKLGNWLLAVHDDLIVAAAAEDYEAKKEQVKKEQMEQLVTPVDAEGQSRPLIEPVGSSSSSLLMGRGSSSRTRKGKMTRMSITATIERSVHPGSPRSRLSPSSASPRSSMDEEGLSDSEARKRRTFDQVLRFYREATKLDGNSYKAWHAWALANVRASEELGMIVPPGESPPRSPRESAPIGTKISSKLHPCVVPAIRAFFRSISLGRRNNVDVLQDILRLLSLWFAHFEYEEVETAMKDGISSLEIESWLAVIPQLIARLKKEDDLVCDLLIRIGTAHPQKLIYPLTVASKSDNQARSNAAKHVMRHMRDSFPDLVDEALVVSRELIRVAVLWHEKWYNRLEEASRHYFSAERDVDAMINILKPLHQEMEAGPETPHEVACIQKFGLDLQEAAEWLYKYIHSEPKNLTFLNSAWDRYYNVFRQIKRQLKSSKHLELRNVSHLMGSSNMLLVVPGTYQAGKPVVRIVGFEPSVRIIPSKQRPRVLTMQGSDGYAHTFLLKGNEDLRMDERVMQLFGLVRGLLQQDSHTSKLRLEIQRYAVVPLSSTSGIVEWVPACDTLNQLIKSYRESRNIPVLVENKLMSDLAPEYDSCTVMQKVEAFEYALDQTSGRDLAKILWLKSPNSEVWVDRRTTYTRSLAAMSMVGYILGLGDRHPSNLMLERSSGRVLHIDFGDCFEVTMQRDTFPEKVPFRLTRMLINAMEASGLDGNFKHTCRAVMHVLRENHESILTILQAFVYDPLVSWRILQPHESRRVEESHETPSGHILSISSERGLNGFPSSPDVRRGSVDSSNRRSVFSSSQPAQSISLKSDRNENLNKRAVDVINRVKAKLTGKDFVNIVDPDLPLPVKDQVSKLIDQATSHENLAQHYRGWSATW